MAVKVRIPTPLQKLTGNKPEVMVEAKSIDAMLADLERQHPGIKERLCDESGKLRRFVNVYVNEEDIRFLQGQETALKDNDDISIIPAIAGGAPAKRMKKRVMLVFPPDQIKEPAVFLMAKKYDIIPNIRQARVTETVGEMTLELDGAEKDIEAGIKFLKARGIQVDPVTGGSAS